MVLQLRKFLIVVNMLRFVTLVGSLFILCYGLERSARLEVPSKNSVPSKSSVTAGSRIIGGEATTIDKYPYTVSLQHEWEEYQYDTIHFCTGGIISREWIVTSANCIYVLEVENSSVRVGSSYFHQGGTVHHVAEVIVHPEWDITRNSYDIALLRLNDSLVFSDLVQAVSLPKANVTVSGGTSFTMASWGSPVYLGDMSTQLLHVTMPTITNAMCEVFWPSRITDTMFCAYKEGEGMCFGDSGAPAVADGVLIGIASLQYSCATDSFPTIYTDISSLVDWITENTNVSGSPLTATVSFYSLLATAIVLVKMRLE